MYLSKLQKFILLECYLSKKRKYLKKDLLKFYNNQTDKIKKEDEQGIITKSVERLIEKELLIGYGEKTPHKWYIREINLTLLGRRTAKKLLGRQQKLPFKSKKPKK